MELTPRVIKPNLYVVQCNQIYEPWQNTKGTEIYFSMDPSSVVPVSREINKIVRVSEVGNLKVKQPDMEFLKTGVRKRPGFVYTIPLTEYLEELERRHGSEMHEFEVPFDEAGLHDLSYVVKACTSEGTAEIQDWRKLQKNLEDSYTFFERFKDATFVLDREQTLELMQGWYDSLDPHIPSNGVCLDVLYGETQSPATKALGVVMLDPLKEDYSATLSRLEEDLVDMLKKVDGPPISPHAPIVLNNVHEFYRGLLFLVPENEISALRDCGFRMSSNWRRRLFQA
ncbi:MAG: hypothetical protein HYW26_03595 [Candidatus Aenigmarchaeota archaeon]|nr:hypothetical protein [Candidatus Aenigmarchaeota archaeon]